LCRYVAEFEVNLSTKPEKSVGGPEIWDKAEGALKAGLALCTTLFCS
jgi:threonyl-tRNA synthetase